MFLYIALTFKMRKKQGDVAQLVEHLTEDQGVAGSSPTVTTIQRMIFI